MEKVILLKSIDKHRCVAYNIDEYRWEVTNLDLNEKKIAMVFKAFCDENRIRILKLLATGEKCACKLLEEIDITQPTMSHHMKILCDSGIVVGRKEGKWMHYSISQEGSETAVKYLKELTIITCLDADKSCCEK
ncbi:MAG: winged helix-turn-helix transcriptional regulator [Firmicutes bacterium]|nr:winged helix-turn-helix transcriptional regulator [Bacillota bacterium]